MPDATTPRDRIVALAKKIQDEGYGEIPVGHPRWGQKVPAYPFVVLGLLMAVEVLDA